MDKARIQLLDAETGVAIKDLDILTSDDAVLMPDGKTVRDKLKTIDDNIALKPNSSDIKIITSLLDLNLSASDMTTDLSTNLTKIMTAAGRNRTIRLYPYESESNNNLYTSIKNWCGFYTDGYHIEITTSLNGASNIPNQITVIPNSNTGNNKLFIGFYDNALGKAQEFSATKKQQLSLLNGWVAYDVQPYMAISGNILSVTMRIRAGTYTAGTTIATTNTVPCGDGSSFYAVTDVSGIKLGSVGLTRDGRIEIVGQFTNNADVCINIIACINN